MRINQLILIRRGECYKSAYKICYNKYANFKLEFLEKKEKIMFVQLLRVFLMNMNQEMLNKLSNEDLSLIIIVIDFN
jgi:hypothetical protein